MGTSKSPLASALFGNTLYRVHVFWLAEVLSQHQRKYTKNEISMKLSFWV